MKKIISMLMAAMLVTACQTETGTGLGMQGSRKEISWNNDVVEFSTLNQYHSAKKNPAIRATLRREDGKRIEMPVDKTGLGYGTSFPCGTSGFYKPDNGIALAEILSMTDERMTIHLSYNEWSIYEAPVTLDKQITLFRDAPVMEVYDYYQGLFDLLNVAAGLTTAQNGAVRPLENGVAVEYPQKGVTAVVIMPKEGGCTVHKTESDVMLTKEVVSGEPIHYYVGISDKGLDYLLEELAKIM
jgi:predicted small secreted protein